MKKLMIAAAIVCAAAFAQAASVTWSVSGLGDPVDGDAYASDGWIARLFTVQDITIDALSKELAKGDFTSWNSKGFDQKATANDGTIAAGLNWATKDAGTYDFYFAVIDSDATGDAEWFFASSAKNMQLVDGSGNETLVAFGDYEAASGAGNWTEIKNVPEPTSGLLLLLGMAGLALRRKQK